MDFSKTDFSVAVLLQLLHFFYPVSGVFGISSNETHKRLFSLLFIITKSILVSYLAITGVYSACETIESLCYQTCLSDSWVPSESANFNSQMPPQYNSTLNCFRQHAIRTSWTRKFTHNRSIYLVNSSSSMIFQHK